MKYRMAKVVEEVRLICAGALVRVMPSARHIVPGKVVFSNFHGRGYGCNPKYIAQELLAQSASSGKAQDPPLDLVWLVREFDREMPSAIRQVRYGSLSALKELSRAHVWVDNVRTRRHVPKKKGQFYVQTWHGCLTPKPVEADIEDMLSRTYMRGAKQDSLDADCMLCNNRFFENIMRRSFWYEGPIVRCGLPRNSALLNPESAVADRVREQLGVPAEAKVCLYAPTFRDNDATKVYHFDYLEVCDALSKRFGGPFVLAVRLHPNVARALGSRKSQTESHRNHTLLADTVGQAVILQPKSEHSKITRPFQVFDVSGFADPIELLVATDVLISDYSSMIEDFALLGRPAFQYVPDREEFMRARGVYYPLESRPYPVCCTEEELQCAILAWDEDTFMQQREQFFNELGLADDGCGANYVARMILDAMGRS